jgi:tRNA dimethylallyltransferase
MGDAWITLIAGPTASGKSALALRLAEETGAEIVNADSMQVYADLRVLTARPTEAEEARAPHHLYGVADGDDPWSVGRWLRAALPVLERLRSAGRPAIVVGGTGLYFRALTRGLAETPDVPDGVRRAAAARLEALGEPAFRAELARLDPEAAARIAPGDRQRLIRARAVSESTGRPLTAWQAETAPPFPAKAWRALVLEAPRAELYARCDARVAAMIEGGALEEVRALAARRLDPTRPVMKAMGVRALADHLAGHRTLEHAVETLRQETRNYAKRQLTWFRNQTPDWPRRDPFTPNSNGMPQ